MNHPFPHPPLALHLLSIALIPFWILVLLALYCTWLVQGPAEWMIQRKEGAR